MQDVFPFSACAEYDMIQGRQPEKMAEMSGEEKEYERIKTSSRCFLSADACIF